ncbi:hypothetical protein LWI29_019584 [Acer saccharum]|uniref:Reverse transcriptase Ty1/copia-type domain-containing protein n=1 Tax=Acer saccharum TaxID=4024 RepID=A0AA39RSH5_ACESA|nr:hypothetical protein LWI29_019584 [Acer saccharum]
MADPKWLSAMKDEYHALQKNHTWSLVLAHDNMNIVGSKWVFRTKFNPDGSILKHKACLVAKGFHETAGLDFFDTYSPVVGYDGAGRQVYYTTVAPPAHGGMVGQY